MHAPGNLHVIGIHHASMKKINVAETFVNLMEILFFLFVLHKHLHTISIVESAI